jgi:5'-nucleotidase
MPVDLSQSLVIGISSRALFDLEEANAVFEGEGLESYTKYQQERQDDILRPGTGFRLVEAILGLNQKVRGGRRAEVVVMSRNSPAAAMRLFKSIEHYQLDIQRAVLSGGTPLAQYLEAFSVALYLSAYESDVRDALQAGVAAAVIYGTPKEVADPCDELRIAFDGDAVLFSNEAERVYQEHGLAKFLEHEREKAACPLPAGPFAKLLRTIFLLQRDPGFEKPAIRTALVTARNMPAHLRVLNTFAAWRIHVDEAFFMGGVPKTEILRAFRPHIFFDDQDVHCRPASEVVSTARVLDSEEPAATSQRPRRRQKKAKQ